MKRSKNKLAQQAAKLLAKWDRLEAKKNGTRKPRLSRNLDTIRDNPKSSSDNISERGFDFAEPTLSRAGDPHPDLLRRTELHQIVWDVWHAIRESLTGERVTITVEIEYHPDKPRQ